MRRATTNQGLTASQALGYAPYSYYLTESTPQDSALLVPHFNHEKARLSEVSNFPESPKWQMMELGLQLSPKGIPFSEQMEECTNKEITNGGNED